MSSSAKIYELIISMYEEQYVAAKKSFKTLLAQKKFESNSLNFDDLNKIINRVRQLESNISFLREHKVNYINSNVKQEKTNVSTTSGVQLNIKENSDIVEVKKEDIIKDNLEKVIKKELLEKIILLLKN